MSRLQSLATVLRHATLVLVVALLLKVGLTLLRTPMTPANFPQLAAPEATQTQLWLATLLGLMTLPVAVWILLRMRALFGQYAEGRVLSPEAATDLQHIGRGLAVLALLPLLIRPAQSVLLSWEAGPGARMLAVSVRDHDIWLLLAAGLVTLVGWAMAEAARIAEDNRGFV